MDEIVSKLPTLNAVLNSCSTVSLLSAYYYIKVKKNRLIHKNLMLLALIFSTFFLASYLTYHFMGAEKKFPTELPTLRLIYLTILIPHVILAVGMLPFIFASFYHAFRNNLEKHKKVARFAFPVWVFVSLTGVIIYFMLFQLAPYLMMKNNV